MVVNIYAFFGGQKKTIPKDSKIFLNTSRDFHEKDISQKNSDLFITLWQGDLKLSLSA